MLLLFAIVGMMLMGMAADLMVVFLALELLSIPLYVLAGIAVPRLNSEEAAIKYFLLGAFSSGFFLYGIALVYGATGSTALKTIAEVVEAGRFDQTFVTLWRGIDHGWIGFQGRFGSIPHVDAGCVSRRSLCGDCLHGGWSESRWLCCAVADLFTGFPHFESDI